ncbi:MAG: hypothetical protein E7222_13095 [Clostridiales bacterium]|nr:hypothetical protein [Clostridiales bacterium]
MAITKQQAKKRLMEIIESGRDVCCEHCGLQLHAASSLDSFEYVCTNAQHELFFCTKCVSKLCARRCQNGKK